MTDVAFSRFYASMPSTSGIRLLLPLALTCCLLYLEAAQCPGSTATGTTRHYYGYCYCLVASSKTWTDANRECNSSSSAGQLLQLESYYKWSNLRRWIDYRSVWIAAFTADSNEWYWANSSHSDLMDIKENVANLTWINVSRSDPDGQCMAVTSYSWRQSDCSSMKYYVCQYPCTTYLTGRRSVLTSPNYPSYYPAYTDCEWYIDVGEGTAVLQFQNFQLEGSQPSCSYDFVKIFEHKNSSSPLAMFCGPTTPDHAIRSPSRYMYISMSTDLSDQYSGFRATVQSSLNPIQSTITASHGVVTSPQFPSYYPNNANVAWLLDVESGVIHITFTDFNIHKESDDTNDDCETDSLTIREGSENGNVLGRYCGTMSPSNLTSNTGSLHLTFTSDSASVSNGFRAIFWSSEETCFHAVQAKGGEVKSINYPSALSTPGYQCIWHIDSMEGVTRLNFIGEISDPLVNFGRYSCSSARLQISDGLNDMSSNQAYRTYCGVETRYNITIPSRYVILTYSASDNYEYDPIKKFQVKYRSSTNCSYTVTAANGTVTSPDFPSFYDPHSNCSWLINVLSGNATLRFYAFAFQEDNSCSKDVFTIYDGNSTAATKIADYCGEVSPGYIAASGPQMFLTMTSDASIGSRGFAAEFFSSDLPCPMWGVAHVHTTKFNNICYGLIKINQTWSTSRSACESHDSSLLRFESKAEFNAVSKWLYSDLRLNQSTSIWTSAYRRTSDNDNWYWSTIDGDLVFTSGKQNDLWSLNEPGDGSAVYMTSQGLVTTNPAERYYSVCEEKTNATSPRRLAKGCSPPPNIKFGYYSVPREYYANSTSVTFSCYGGFTLSDTATITCIDGRWDKHIPSCIPVSTETPTTLHDTCNPLPAVLYGSFAPSLSVYKHGSELRVKCIPGYYSKQDMLMKCMNGHWTGTLPYCERVTLKDGCSPPTGVLYAKLDSDKQEYSTGENVTLYCDTQTNVTTDDRIMTCLKGSWRASLHFQPCPGDATALNVKQNKAANDDRYYKLLGGTITIVVLVVLAVIIAAMVKLVKYRRNRQKSSPLLEMEDHDADSFGFS